jgi:hypothetical protein
VIDPAKVVCSAPQHAASIASLLLATEAVILQIPEEHKSVSFLARRDRAPTARAESASSGVPAAPSVSDWSIAPSQSARPPHKV